MTTAPESSGGWTWDRTGCGVHPNLANPFCPTCKDHVPGPEINPLWRAEQQWDAQQATATGDVTR